jgi:quercetin dioxygenase-like cupin family protein
MRKRGMLLVAVVALCAAVGGTTVAGATPGSGVLSGRVLAQGVFQDGLDAKFKVSGHHGTQVSRIDGAARAVVQEIVLAPGGHTGWHSHPGPVVVVVRQGPLTLYDGAACGPGRTYASGEAFVDPGQGHLHIARNEGNRSVELVVTYFAPPGTGVPRIDREAPADC